MTSSPLTQPQLLTLGCGLVLTLLVALWLLWKVGKFVIKTVFFLLLVGAAAALALWFLAPR